MGQDEPAAVLAEGAASDRGRVQEAGEVTALEALAEAHATGRLARPCSWRAFSMGIGWDAASEAWTVEVEAGGPEGGGTAAMLPGPEELVEEWEVVERKGAA